MLTEPRARAVLSLVLVEFEVSEPWPIASPRAWTILFAVALIYSDAELAAMCVL
jgi:hypothetical protein